MVSQLGRAMTRVSDAQRRVGNELGLLENGPATYEDWLGEIEVAKRWVHLENYIFKADRVGHRFAEALAAKAREGVPVRILYDWFGSMDVPRSFWEELRQAGVEARAVNPPTLREPLDFLLRDHRKPSREELRRSPPDPLRCPRYDRRLVPQPSQTLLHPYLLRSPRSTRLRRTLAPPLRL